MASIICDIKGTVSWEEEGEQRGGLKLWHYSQTDTYKITCYHDPTGACHLFYIVSETLVRVTNDQVILSNVQGALDNKNKTVHLKRADPNDVQGFIDALPSSIKVEGKEELRSEKKEHTHDIETQLRKKDKQLRKAEVLPRETGEGLGREEQLREKDEKLRKTEEHLRRREEQLRRREEQLRRREAQVQGTEEQLRKTEVLPRGERLGREEQLREKDEQLRWTELRRREEQLRRREAQVQETEEHLRKTEEQLTEKDKQLREKDAQKQNLLRELTTLRGDNERERAKLLEKLNAREPELTRLEKELRDREQDYVVVQKELCAAKEKLSKYESQLMTREWLISRDEVEIIRDECLGKGSYGKVYKGRYRGYVVAVKEPHDMTLTPQERDLFEREMDIASKCRHPCLLQFIGATQGKKPLLVTELMESSLRILLGKQPLSDKEVIVISLDVAHALNYLHHRKPKPIVHRDVSSANVLLWKQNDQWRGKLGDYGTAKFLQEIMTRDAGAMSYSAPEAGSPHNQTVKIDVYSFGVLCCEMCIRDLPNFDNRKEQVKLVRNKEFQALIMWCIELDPDMRPSMEEVIQKLEHFIADMS